MRKIISLTALAFIYLSFKPVIAAGDPATTGAVLQQTVIQTAEHLRQVSEMVRTIQTLQEQLTSTRGLLELAKKSAEGIEVFKLAGDFRNIVLATNDVIKDVRTYIDSTGNLPERWNQLFGSLDPWVADAKSVFRNIDISDKTSTSGYLIADSYQKMYEKNTEMVNKFIENAQQVNEKGALKQIAEETAQLIQMENNTIYLLSEMLKGQSVQASNENLKRKEEAIRFEQENNGIKAFLSLVDDKTFGI